MKKRFELDFLGQYYASVINEKQSGMFSIAVHLKEALNVKILKQALIDLGEQFPFLSGHLRKNFFWYEYEITSNAPLMIPAEDFSETRNQENLLNKQVFRVVYGQCHFSVEVNHTLFDGRTLMKITRALLIRYFEVLGVQINGNEILNCNHSEELENAYLRFANSKNKKKKSDKKKDSLETLAYRPPVSANAPVKTLSYKLSASKVKAAAKAYQATVTEYLLALILKGIAVERACFESKEPIIASIPIDCRSFFPTETMRNFVSAQNILMPETEDMASMIEQLQKQFSKIDKNLIYEDFSSLQEMYQFTRYFPRKFKDFYMKRMQRLEAAKHTTGLSNVGMVKLPESILNQIDFMEFSIDTVGETPYYFSCITVGDVLTLKGTVIVDDTVLIEELEKSLTQKFGLNSAM